MVTDFLGFQLSRFPTFQISGVPGFQPSVLLTFLVSDLGCDCPGFVTVQVLKLLTFQVSNFLGL